MEETKESVEEMDEEESFRELMGESCSIADRSRSETEDLRVGAENRFEGGIYGCIALGGVKIIPCVNGVNLVKCRIGSVLGRGGRGFEPSERVGRVGTDAEWGWRIVPDEERAG